MSWEPIEPVLVYNTDGFKPESWSDLTGEIVGIVEGTGLEATLAKVRTDHPDVQWRPLGLPAADGLIEQVSEGSLGYAVVASNEAAVARNIFLSVETGFAVGPKQDLVWVLPAAQAALRDRVDAFFDVGRRAVRRNARSRLPCWRSVSSLASPSPRISRGGWATRRR